MLAATTALGFMSLSARAATPGSEFFVGAYTTDSSKGIVPLFYAADSNTWTLGAPVTQIENASFAVRHPSGKLWYMLNEQADGKVGAWARHEDGSWTPVAEVSSHGDAPCFVSTDDTGGTLGVANYNTGDVVFYRTDAATGAPLEPASIRRNTGSGPNKDRQSGPHAHCVRFTPQQDFIYSNDLGTDQVLGYPFDAASQTVGDVFTAVTLPGGQGPRHIVFHPSQPLAFLVTEMGNCVFVLRREKDGTLSIVQQISTIPADFTGHSQAAHIVLNQATNRLYVSNRGHNSIIVYDVAADGSLTTRQIVSTEGDWPRFFLLLEDKQRVVVAHQNGGTLNVFSVKPDGSLASTGQVLKVPQPVFIGQLI